jgi:hypothetical protein
MNDTIAEQVFPTHAEKIEQKEDLKSKFEYIQQTNMWSSDESLSGPGSTLDATKIVRDHLPILLKHFKAKSMLDLPCGDFNWMQHTDLGRIAYIGADIVPALVEQNVQKYRGPKRNFMCLDITKDALPKVSVVFCRDCLVHLSHENIQKAFRQIRASKSKYVLMTHFTEPRENRNIVDANWRPINFQLAPFNMPKPLAIIVEGCTEADGMYKDKSLGLWRTKDLPNKIIA